MKPYLAFSIFIFSLGCTRQSSQLSQATAAAPSSNSAVAANQTMGLQTSGGSLLRLATKNLVASTLSSIFGTGSNHVAQMQVVTSLVSSQFNAFGGGPCDQYKPGDCATGPTNGNVAGPVLGDDVSGASLFPQVPSAASSRLALMTRACDSIMSIDDAVLFAANQVVATPATLLANLPTPTDQNIAGAFGLFYTIQPPTADVLTSLKMVVDRAEQQGYSSSEAWRFLFLSLCLSPGWHLT